MSFVSHFIVLDMKKIKDALKVQQCMLIGTCKISVKQISQMYEIFTAQCLYHLKPEVCDCSDTNGMKRRTTHRFQIVLHL